MAPHLLAGVEIPSLQFADMIGAGSDIHGRGGPDITLTGRVGGGFPSDRAAQIFVRRDVEQLGLWAVGDWWPVLATPQRRAEIGFFAGCRLPDRVDVGPPGFGIETREDV